MRTLRLLLGDQLTRAISSLDGLDAAQDAVLLVEVAEETTYVRHHKQKIALILSAMRHFAAGLAAEGVRVDYVPLDDPANTGAFTTELARAAARHRPDRIVVTEPGEWRVLDAMRTWQDRTGIPVEIRGDDRFFCSRPRFARWARGQSTYRMEFFYRQIRRETGILMDGDAPAGGRWNFDRDNRKRLPAALRHPGRDRFPPDQVTRQVLDLMARRFPGHFGTLDGFGWAVTRADALAALGHFVQDCLPSFGDYQDAMRAGAPFLFHAVLSPYLNIGLLTPREVCHAAERAYHDGLAPLNAAEGFIRQILGWREFVRGTYWHRMPEYAGTNALAADRDLPGFYWTGETGMNCLAQVVRDIGRHAYAHHIQRLMVTGNFALLAGIAPRQVEEWYLIIFADAFEWVELPNVHGLILYADGGLLASKPYAASGAYIDRMSDYCRPCRYDPKAKAGPRACPFNLLYVHFLQRNRAALEGNPRLALPYRNLDAMGAADRDGMLRQAETFLAGLSQPEDPPAQPALAL